MRVVIGWLICVGGQVRVFVGYEDIWGGDENSWSRYLESDEEGEVCI